MRGLAWLGLAAAAFVRSENSPAKYNRVVAEHEQLQIKRKGDRSEYWLVREDFAKTVVLYADADRKGWVGPYTTFCIKEQRSADAEAAREAAHEAAKARKQTRKAYDPCDAHLEGSVGGSKWVLKGGLHCEDDECFYLAPNGARVQKPPVFASVAYVNEGRLTGSGVREMEVHLNYGRETYLNVKPTKDATTGEDILLFHAGQDGQVRVELPSVKNFILADFASSDRTDLMQLGKSAATDLFNVDIFTGMTQLQAFGVALSSLAWKLTVK